MGLSMSSHQASTNMIQSHLSRLDMVRSNPLKQDWTPHLDWTPPNLMIAERISSKTRYEGRPRTCGYLLHYQLLLTVMVEASSCYQLRTQVASSCYHLRTRLGTS